MRSFALSRAALNSGSRFVKNRHATRAACASSMASSPNAASAFSKWFMAMKARPRVARTILSSGFALSAASASRTASG